MSVALLTVGFVLGGCYKNPYGQITEGVHESCPAPVSPGCIVDLKEVFDFDWDTLFVFHPDVSGDMMREVTGTDSNFGRNQDNETRFVFLKKGTVAATMLQTGNPIGDTVSFTDGTDNRTWHAISFEQSQLPVVEVLKRPGGGEAYFASVGEKPPVTSLSPGLTDSFVMRSAPHIEHTEPHGDHTITLTFENGERRAFDFKPYLQTPVFAPLSDLDLFRQVRIVYGSLEWPGERDLAYDSLYAESRPTTGKVHG